MVDEGNLSCSSLFVPFEKGGNGMEDDFVQDREIALVLLFWAVRFESQVRKEKQLQENGKSTRSAKGRFLIGSYWKGHLAATVSLYRIQLYPEQLAMSPEDRDLLYTPLDAPVTPSPNKWWKQPLIKIKWRQK